MILIISIVKNAFHIWLHANKVIEKCYYFYMLFKNVIP